MNRAFGFGAVLACGLANMAYGLPATLAYAALILRKRLFPNEYYYIFILTLVKAGWMVAVYLIYSNKSMYSMLQLMAQDAIFILMLFIPTNTSFLKQFLRPAIYLFIIDFLFNISIAVFGFDPLGRGGGLRPGDFIPRLGGLFGNPVYTVSITTAAFIIGVSLSKKWLIYMSAVGLLINGTQRAPLTLVLILVMWFLLKNMVRARIVYLICLCFVAAVFLVTYYSAMQAEDVSGNLLRVIAWGNSIEKIILSPIAGYHDFLSGEFEEMSVDTILDFGITESPYLQIAVDFGVLPAIISLYTIYLIFKRCIKLYYYDSRNHYYFASALFSGVVFADRFYGSIYGGMFVTFIYCALCVSFRGQDESDVNDYSIANVNRSKSYGR